MKMNKIKSLFVAIGLLLSTSVSAYDFEVDGMQYDVVSLSDLTCKLVGSKNGFEGDFVIPDHVNYSNNTLTVVEIRDELFKNCKLTGITIPNTILSIGDRVFEGCTNLEYVKIEDGETILELGVNWHNNYGVGKGLFYDSPIKSLYIGRNLSYSNESGDGISPFYLSKELTELTISNFVTKIGVSAFCNCSSLTSVTIPNSVTEIGGSAFADCCSLTSITIPNSVTVIGGYAFLRCSSLTSVTIPNSVTGIDIFTFDGCSSLTSVTIPNSVTEIGRSAFEGCSSLTSITIPNSVTEIGGCAFLRCSSLTSVTIPNSVTEIGGSAFSRCTSLKSVIISNSVTVINEGMFDRCSSLTSLTIGNSVERIRGYATFQGCAAMAELYSLNPTPPVIESYSLFRNNHYMTLKVYVPKGSLKAYQEAKGWGNFWNIAEFDPTDINQITTDNDAPSTIYDLQGNKLTSPKRGINVINGKKIVVK